MRCKASKALVLILIGGLTLMGCSLHRPPESPYMAHYGNRLSQVRVPSVEMIHQAGALWTFAKPLEEVWAACLRVVPQYEGLLGLQTDHAQARRLLFVHGQEMLWTVKGAYKNRGMVVNKFLDTWIAVAVSTEEGNEKTTVAAAWVSPTTGEVMPLSTLAADPQAGAQPAPAQTASLAALPQGRSGQTFEAITSALVEEQASLATKLGKAETPEDRWQLIPQATINEFFYHLALQLLGPERWQAKLSTPGTPAPRSPKALDDVIRNTAYDEHALMERDIGNWTSAKLRRTFLMIHSPPMETLLTEMADRLKAVAKEQDRQVRVYIVASPQINAFTVPNGDIFVTTSLLEAAESVDEVAAVMAHELDHLFQHDTTARLEEMRNARNLRQALMIVGAIAGAGVGAVAGIAVAGAQAMAAGTNVAGTMVQNLVSNTIQMTGGSLSQSLGTALVSGHNETAELRADANGAKYLWAAGYDVEAELSVLEKLKTFKAQAEQRKEPVTSGFLNAAPGLEKRLEAMKPTLGELRGRSGAH